MLFRSIKKLTGEQNDLDEALKDLVKEIAQKQIALEAFQDERRNFEVRLKELKERKMEIETITDIEPTEFEITDNLDHIYQKIKFIKMIV